MKINILLKEKKLKNRNNYQPVFFFINYVIVITRNISNNNINNSNNHKINHINNPINSAK